MTVDAYSSMAVIDLTVFGAAILIVGFAAFSGLLKFERNAGRGQLLIALGVLIPATYYVIDLLTINVLPPMIGDARSLLIMNYVHLSVHWLTPVVTLGLVFMGLAFLAIERKRSDASLKLIQVRLNEAQHIANIGSWDWSIVTNELWWSDQIYRMFQVDSTAFGATYEAFLERVHPEDRQIVNESVERALAGGESYSIVHRIVLPDDTEKAVHEKARVIFNDEGQAIRMTGTVHDITERMEAEENIRYRDDYEAMLIDFSTQLIRARPAEIGKQLSSCLEQIGTRYELDSISMWWFTENRDSMRATQRWERIEGREPPEFRDGSKFSWFSEHLLAGKTVVVGDVEQMPPQAVREQTALQQWEMKSVLIAPLAIDDKLEGACLFSTVRKKHAWSAKIEAELTYISTNLACTYARAQAMLEIEQLKDQLHEENLYLREEVRVAYGFDKIIGDSRQLREALSAAEKVAPTDVPVLILGETGTGKELIAQAIHDLSERKDHALICVNCAALSKDLIESELFGHEKGAFTGAHSQRKGRFELADGGTLFLDEVGELHGELQAKLLRVVQTGDFERLGGSQTLHANARLIAATNKNLKSAVDDGEFRADLYYRISSYPVRLPPLRDRPEDIPALVEFLVAKHAKRMGKDIQSISARTIRYFASQRWPGNVRELEGTIQRALISTTGPVLDYVDSDGATSESLALSAAVPANEAADLRTVERQHIRKVLENTRWVIDGKRGAAAMMAVAPSTLRSKMKRLGIKRSE